jgi:hypothetical protein
VSAPVSCVNACGEIAELRGLGVFEALDAYRDEGCRASVAELTGAGGPGYYLRQLALASVVAEWMRVGAVISAHHALLAGAGVGEVAAAMGCLCPVLIRRWRSWAEGQAELERRVPGLGLSAEVFALVEARLAGVCDGCAGTGHEDVGRHVGSPYS